MIPTMKIERVSHYIYICMYVLDNTLLYVNVKLEREDSENVRTRQTE